MTVAERIMAIAIVSLGGLILLSPSLPKSRYPGEMPVGYHIPLG